MTELCTFSTFTRVLQICSVYNFFGAFLKNFFNRFEISTKFCVFETFFDFFKKKKILLGHISRYGTFSNFKANRAKNGAKKPIKYVS